MKNPNFKNKLKIYTELFKEELQMADKHLKKVFIIISYKINAS